jgi:hypothetical protein
MSGISAIGMTGSSGKLALLDTLGVRVVRGSHPVGGGVFHPSQDMERSGRTGNFTTRRRKSCR